MCPKSSLDPGFAIFQDQSIRWLLGYLLTCSQKYVGRWFSILDFIAKNKGIETLNDIVLS